MKRRIYHIAAVSLWLLAIGLLMTACAEDIDNSQEQNANGKQPITFDVSANQNWNLTSVETRSSFSEGSRKANSVPVTCNGIETGMTLTAMTVNGINSDAFKEKELTRGEARTTLYDNFNILAYEYPETEAWGTQKVSYTETASLISNVWTMVNSNHFWPTGGNVIRYVGYAPATTSDLIAPTIADAGGLPTFTYTVPKSVISQTDLMAAVSPISKYTTNSGRMKMEFKHLLTCVKFAIGEDLAVNSTIKTIRLRNVARKGSVTLGDTFGWNVDESSRTDFEMTNINFYVSPTATKNTIIAPNVTDGEKQTTMLMIPQEFNDDNQIIEIEFDDKNGTSRTVSATLNESKWLPGTTVTYLLSTGEIDKEYVLTASSVVIGHDGGNATFGITSYVRTTGKTDPLPWKIIGYSLDEGKTFYSEKPAECNWVGIATTSGKGGAQEDIGRLVVDPMSPDSTEVLNDLDGDPKNAVTIQKKKLQANPKKGGQTDYYDLSIHDFFGNPTLRNTANCYVINSWGYYQFPLVYGNAIKNGEPNTSAYSAVKAVHNGNMTSPYLEDNSVAPSYAKLLWQDAEGLISEEATDVQLVSGSDGHKYVRFLIPYDNITPGNAVIAVFDSNNTIMWSWHIWVTAIDIYSTIAVTAANNAVYNLMRVNIGWCPTNGSIVNYTTRSMIIKVEQSTGQIATFRVTQSGGSTFTDETRGYCPFYQWGRKDPLYIGDNKTFSATNGTGVLHEVWPTNTAYKWTTFSGPTTMANAIKNPHKFISSSNNWCTQNQYLWNTNGNTGTNYGTVIKTIYDPSPVGFHTAPPGAFTGFTTTGGTVYSHSQTSVVDAHRLQCGYLFWTNSAQKKETIFFPMPGYLAANASFNLPGYCGHSWTSTLLMSFRYVEYSTTQYEIGVFQESHIGYGFPVRPAADY